MKRLIQRIGLEMILALFSAPLICATDIPVFPTGPVFQLNNLVWGQSGPIGFNNNFFFTPLNQNESVCVFVYNNNTTSAHGFSMSIAVTGNPSSTKPSDGTWQNVASTGGSQIIAPPSPGSGGGIGTSVSGASQISIGFTNSSTQAGSPETANITISQTQGTCPSGANLSGGNTSSVIATVPIAGFSESLGQAYMASSGVITNPASAANIIHVTTAAETSRTLYFYKTSVVCSATCSIALAVTTTTGTTCTAVSIPAMRLTATVTSVATANQLCGTIPGSIQFFNITLSAGVPYDFDDTGFIIPPNGTGASGLEVIVTTGFTGTISSVMRWYEK